MHMTCCVQCTSLLQAIMTTRIRPGTTIQQLSILTYRCLHSRDMELLLPIESEGFDMDALFPRNRTYADEQRLQFVASEDFDFSLSPSPFETIFLKFPQAVLRLPDISFKDSLMIENDPSATNVTHPSLVLLTAENCGQPEFSVVKPDANYIKSGYIRDTFEQLRILDRPRISNENANTFVDAFQRNNIDFWQFVGGDRTADTEA